MSAPHLSQPRDADNPRRPLRVAMLLHGDYPWDERVRREAAALIDAGHSVEVLCLRHDQSEPLHETVNAVVVHRTNFGRSRGQGRLSYIREYGATFISFATRLTRLHASNPFDVVQVHTLPDALVFATLPVKMAGARVVLDVHDLMPELYASKFGLAPDARLIRALAKLERLSTRYADAVLASSELFAERLEQSGVSGEKMTLVLNSPDPDVFIPTEAGVRSRPGDDFRIIWHGTLVRRYGVDLVVRAVALLGERIPGLSMDVYGSGEHRSELEALVAELDLADRVTFRGEVPQQEIARCLAAADVGVVPNRRDEHIDRAYPTKLLEYVQMGVPVVTTWTPTLAHVFDDTAVRFVAPTPEGFAEGLLAVYLDPEAAAAMASRAQTQMQRISWGSQARDYVRAVESVIR